MLEGAAFPCPRCRRDAPAVLRGSRAYCTACGAERPVIGSHFVELAGKPSRIGGLVATVAGWLAIAGALALGGALYAVTSWLFPGSPLPYLALFAGAAGAVVGALLLFAGKRLRKSGEDAGEKAREDAVRSLALGRGGALTARDAALALAMSEGDADALLTRLAKRADARVSVEIDDAGGIYYAFQGASKRRFEAQPRARFAGEGALEVEEPQASEQARARR